MKKAFTMIELLVVIAIIAILAAMLMPALSKARREGEKTFCRYNMHNQGLALAIFGNNNNGTYPGWVELIARNRAHDGSYLNDTPNTITPETWVENLGGPMYQLYSGGYMEDADVLDCPGVRLSGAYNTPEEPTAFPCADYTGHRSTCAAHVWGTGGVDNCNVIVAWNYAHDIGRVDKNSMAGRVVAGDLQRCSDGYAVNRWGPNHTGGSNVLCMDNAVLWAAKTHADSLWLRIRIWGLTGSSNIYDLGYVPNPRIDEDMYYVQEGVDLDNNGIEDRIELETEDVDCIYAWEQAADGSPIGPTTFVSASEAPDDQVRPGGMAPGAWGWSNSNPAESAWRPFWSHWDFYHFPQRGIYAGEPRWNKHDTRLVSFVPVSFGGMAGWPHIDWFE